MEQRKDTVEDLGRALKETVPAELKERVEQAVQDSIKMVEKGKWYVDHVKARLEFISADSESGSYKGPMGRGAAPSQWRSAAEELGDKDKEAEASKAGPEGLVSVLRGWGQLKVNDSGWLTFDGGYASYPRFKREWTAYRETYHSVLNDDLAAKVLRDKCIKGDALRMVNHLDDLQEIWDTLDTCFERPEKYMEEVLRPIVEFKKYRATDSCAVREFYLLLGAAIKGAKGIERLGLLINDQTIPRIISKMPYTDWKKWATRRPEWLWEDLGPAFEGFVERKWQDALNVAAAEPLPWGTEKEKTTAGKVAVDKPSHAHKGAGKASGAVNVVSQQSPPRSHSPSWDISSGRRCRAQFLIGCNGNHVVLQCAKLLELGLDGRRKVLEQSGLCMYCLKHAAELECFWQGGFSKPRCMQPGCGGEHAVGAKKLLGEGGACVNLATGDDHESEEEEEWWVNTVRVGEEEEDLEEVEDSGTEKGGEREGQYITSTCMRKDDSGLEDELEYFWEAPIPSDSSEREEDRWWSPGPQEPSSEEDEEEVRYLTNLLWLGPKENKAEDGEPPPEDAPGAGGSGRSTPPGKPVGSEEEPSGVPRGVEPPPAKKLKRKGLKKKEIESEGHRWEIARRDAWLRELLTDSSGSETEEEYTRFAESGRWIAEMTGNRDEKCCEQEEGMEAGASSE